MLVTIPKILSPEQLAWMRQRLDGATWIDGRATAGTRAAQVKNNRQIGEQDPLAAELGAVILSGIERNPLFIGAVLPNIIYPPMFNRYEAGMAYGTHFDNAVRILPGSNIKFRTDVSATLFLSEPEEYEGGELVIQDTYGAHAAKLPAGDLLVYPASSLHRVEPVTRGARIASFFWCQSLVSDDAQRQVLLDIDCAIQRLNLSGAEPEARIQMSGAYHNLLRMWSRP